MAYSLVGLLAVLALLFAATAAHWSTVFSGSRPTLVDGDCYARMSRVQLALHRPGLIVHKHDFENYPAGTQPHTTAPFDWLIIALGAVIHTAGIPWQRALDLAGAWISPLLAAAALVFLWLWSGWEKLPYRWAALTFFAISPILAHGFALGRPDHQSLEVALLAMALAAEWSQWRRPSRRWALAGGTAWGLALWTSLYEPLICAAAVLVADLILARRSLWRRERLEGLLVMTGILLLALAIEGWHLDVPGWGENGALFTGWARKIGELKPVPPWDGILYRWNGLLLVAAPVLLVLAWRNPNDLWAGERAAPDSPATAPHSEPEDNARQVALGQLGLLVLLFMLTCWQIRWGYFLALANALSLPWQLSVIRRRWLGYGIWLLALWPLIAEWKGPPAGPQRDALIAAETDKREESGFLQDTAAFIRKEAALSGTQSGVENMGQPSPAPRGILAPWWLSPALAYWSGEPALAGSSHESLPGIGDTARFFFTSDRAQALSILHTRRVRWVVVDDPERVLPTSAAILSLRVRVAAQGNATVMLYEDLFARDSTMAMEGARGTMARVLYEDPAEAPRFLRFAYANPDFKVYEVAPMPSGGAEPGTAP